MVSLSSPFARSASRMVLAAVVVGIALAVLGPFGSYLNEGPLRRGGYWIAAMLLAVVLYGAAVRVVMRRVTRERRWFWMAIGAAVLVASVPEAVATRVLALWLWPDLGRHAPGWIGWFAQTSAIGLVLTVAVVAFQRKPAPAVAAASLPPLIDPQDQAFAGDVIALQMEDHYVRVHRTQGSILVLMPLTQAIARMRKPGLRTHRSWWVARDAVVAVEGNARSMRLRLTGDLSAPVARSAVAQLRAAGWLEEGAA